MRDLRGSAVRFAIVGGMATAVHVLVFLALQRGAGLHPTASTVLAFLVAVGVSYTLNRTWTFAAVGRHGRHLPRFLLVALSGAAANAAIMHVTTEVLDGPPLVGLAAVVLVVPGLSFLGNRYWGFR